MKRFLILCGILFSFLWIYVVIQILFGHYFEISSEIEAKIPITAKIDYTDNHGGFHMDGTTRAVVNLNEKQAQKFINQIKNNNHWYELPMEEMLQKSINNHVAESMELPKIQNGYWFILDRSSEAINEYYYDKVFYRASVNFSVAVFDVDSNTLYYLRRDT